MGPGSCLCPARAALPVPLGPPLAQVACPSPFPEPRGAGALDGARSRWRPSPRVCKFEGERRAGLGCGVSGNGAPVGDLVWSSSALGCQSRCWSRPPRDLSLGPARDASHALPLTESAVGSLRMPQGPPPGTLFLGPCDWPGRQTLAFCKKCWT